MYFRVSKSIVLIGLFLMMSASASLMGDVVRFETSLGDFRVQLFEEVAPKTVANFVNYVSDGDYENSIVHRSIPGFVIQGGGFDSGLSDIPTDDPVVNEFSLSNLRGTIAMAKLGGDPNSATSQWFINLADNEFLDSQNSGFTVFGEVFAEDLSVIDAIAGVETYGLGGPFRDIPLVNYSNGRPRPEQMVVIERIQQVPEPQSMGIVSSLLLILWQRRRMRG